MMADAPSEKLNWLSMAKFRKNQLRDQATSSRKLGAGELSILDENRRLRERVRVLEFALKAASGGFQNICDGRVKFVSEIDRSWFRKLHRTVEDAISPADNEAEDEAEDER